MRYLSAWILLLSASVYGQLITGSISGRVEDPSGLAVSGASVIITRTATNAVRKAASDENGAFVFNGVEPGEYRLSVASAGFKTIERERLTLSSGERLAVGELRLEVGSITETVMVKGEAAHVDTESAARADLITGSQVDGLLNLGRNVTSLVGLLPGVVITRDSNSLDRDTQFNVAGGRMTSNNISIDGVPVVDLDNGFSRKMNVSQDMVAEVKILASNYQAEYGRNSGANIFVVTKSGSRDFHGLASYLKRHEQFNANSFFNNQQGLAKPVYRYNTWTYNVGGPIYIPGRFNRERDKLFFFWGQEFWPTTQSVNGRVTVPTESERAGDFSQTFDVNNRLITVTDPLSKTAFPGNRVPANRINQSGQALLKIFDAPNFFDRNISRGNYNYVFGSPNNVPKTTSTLKLDYNINSNNQIGGTFSTFSETSEGAVGTTGNNANWPQMVMKFNAPNKSAGGRYTRIFTPSIINEFQFGFLRNPESHSYQPDQLMRLQRDKVGFLTPQFHPESNPLKIVPNLTFGGVTSPATINVNGRFPANNQYRVLTFDDKLSIVRGGHSLKAGIFIERDDRDVNQAVAFNGSIDFGRNVNNPLDSGYAYANALLGNFNSYTEPSSRPRIFARAHTVEWFAQDNWKVSRRLTLDFGVRFYWVPPIYDDRDLIAGFAPDRYNVAARARLVSPATVGGQRVGIDPASGRTFPAVLIGSFVPGSGDTANGMVVAAQNNDYPRGLTENPGVQAAPRIGIAFDPFGDGKTSIRSGFGIFYNRLGASVWLPFTAQPPLVTTPNIYYGQLDTLASSAGALFPSNVSGMSRDGKIPSTMNYSFSIQRNVGFSTLVEAAYVGSVARHLTWYRNINPVPAGRTSRPPTSTPPRAVRSRPLSSGPISGTTTSPMWRTPAPRTTTRCRSRRIDASPAGCSSAWRGPGRSRWTSIPTTARRSVLSCRCAPGTTAFPRMTAHTYSRSTINTSCPDCARNWRRCARSSVGGRSPA